MSKAQAPRRNAAVAPQAPSATPQEKRPATAEIGPESALDAAEKNRAALGAGGILALQAAAGNRAVAGLVQARWERPRTDDRAGVHEAAKLGIGGASGELPYLETIQQAFGRHDVTGVVAHTGAQATAGARAMGAAAFTMGNHVAFAGSADLHTAAHEAAHVVQQRAGVQLSGGVGVPGDRYEQHADAVAALVVQGRSAEAGLDQVVGRAPDGSEPGGTAAMAGGDRAIQMAKPIQDIFNFVEQNRVALGEVAGIQMRRLLHWNDVGRFDDGPLVLRKVRRLMGERIPLETAAPGRLPAWMDARVQFGVKLPAFFGGGRLVFRKAQHNVVFEGRGWISDNFFWRAPNPPRVRYLIHAILEWNGAADPQGPPTPHITLRNAETQARIDLDTSNPQPNARVQGLEATQTSFSQGLGVNRNPGIQMVDDAATFADLKSAPVQAWLRDLRDAAQEALFPELQHG